MGTVSSKEPMVCMYIGFRAAMAFVVCHSAVATISWSAACKQGALQANKSNKQILSGNDLLVGND